MRRNIEIPEALRICSACGEDVCSQCEFCDRCLEIHEDLIALELQHAQRANQFFEQQPRQVGLMPGCAPAADDGSHGIVARCVLAGFDWIGTLSRPQAFALLGLGLAVTWFLIGLVAGKV